MKTAVIILLLLCVALAAVVMYLLAKRPKVVEISDTLPKSKRKRDCWLKLQNEGKPYLRIEGDRVYLKVVK